MIQLRCEDFNDVFIKVNRLFLLKPELVEYIDIEKGYIRNILVSCTDIDIDIDISKLGYRRRKWSHLVNNYLSEPDILNLKNKMDNTTSLTVSFYFKNEKPDKDTCLLGFILGRKSRRDPWNSLSITYRVCESERKLAVDLILINRIMTEYLQISPTEITIYFSHCYCNADLINGVFNLFGVNREDLNSNIQFTKYVQNCYNRRFLLDSPISLHAATKKMQLLSFGKLNLEPIPVKTLSIKEVINK